MTARFSPSEGSRALPIAMVAVAFFAAIRISVAAPQAVLSQSAPLTRLPREITLVFRGRYAVEAYSLVVSKLYTQNLINGFAVPITSSSIAGVVRAAGQ